jgi:hypothetical protein
LNKFGPGRAAFQNVALSAPPILGVLTGSPQTRHISPVPGAIYQWSPGDSTFELISGTELPGNNGIEVSLDEQEIYVSVLKNRPWILDSPNSESGRNDHAASRHA